MDLFDKRADYNNDLNTVFTLNEKFDLITSPGTAEHCFNIGSVFVNIHNHLNINGICLSILPAAGQITHGYYNIHPYLYVDMCRANDYEILSFHYIDDLNVKQTYVNENPQTIYDFTKNKIKYVDIINLSHLEFDILVQDNFVKNFKNNFNKKYRKRYPEIKDYCFVAYKKTKDPHLNFLCNHIVTHQAVIIKFTDNL